MSDTNWMEAEAYDLADKISEKLTMAYKQGVNDAWMNIKSLWNEGVCSFEWSAEEMMLYAERTDKSRKEVEDISADRPSGHWVLINRGLNIYMCDQCREILQIDRVPIWDYCPVCGARMGGETDGRPNK